MRYSRTFESSVRREREAETRDLPDVGPGRFRADGALWTTRGQLVANGREFAWWCKCFCIDGTVQPMTRLYQAERVRRLIKANRAEEHIQHSRQHFQIRSLTL